MPLVFLDANLPVTTELSTSRPKINDKQLSDSVQSENWPGMSLQHEAASQPNNQIKQSNSNFNSTQDENYGNIIVVENETEPLTAENDTILTNIKIEGQRRNACESITNQIPKSVKSKVKDAVLWPDQHFLEKKEKNVRENPKILLCLQY